MSQAEAGDAFLGSLHFNSDILSSCSSLHKSIYEDNHMEQVYWRNVVAILIFSLKQVQHSRSAADSVLKDAVVAWYLTDWAETYLGPGATVTSERAGGDHGQHNNIMARI